MTAVQWLLKQISHNPEWHSYLGKIEIKKKAIEMEREQIKNSYNQGFRDGEPNDELNRDIAYYSDAENYYNQTYGQ